MKYSTLESSQQDESNANYTQELLKLIKIAQNILMLLKDREAEKIKGQDKPKKDNDFYQEVIRKLAYEIFHEHKQVTDEQMKIRIKEKLDADEQCISILQKSEVKGLTFDKLWDKKIKTAISYYVRRVKSGLWSTFSINQIKPFRNNFTKHQMKEWKQHPNMQKVYEDLYKSSDAENEDDSNNDNADESAEYLLSLLSNNKMLLDNITLPLDEDE
ncbi:hypothetical protein C1646_756656 [Rhizophagus diaphanus]|nr:hypothetical protein C1646_756656 [Rhizophagus diaphanus] [Rhizophagus sp. MUCL 43196]